MKPLPKPKPIKHPQKLIDIKNYIQKHKYYKDSTEFFEPEIFSYLQAEPQKIGIDKKQTTILSSTILHIIYKAGKKFQCGGFYDLEENAFYFYL
jgi:hypothetical protein